MAIIEALGFHRVHRRMIHPQARTLLVAHVLNGFFQQGIDTLTLEDIHSILKELSAILYENDRLLV